MFSSRETKWKAKPDDDIVQRYAKSVLETEDDIRKLNGIWPSTFADALEAAAALVRKKYKVKK